MKPWRRNAPGLFLLTHGLRRFQPPIAPDIQSSRRIYPGVSTCTSRVHRPALASCLLVRSEAGQRRRRVAWETPFRTRPWSIL